MCESKYELVAKSHFIAYDYCMSSYSGNSGYRFRKRIQRRSGTTIEVLIALVISVLLVTIVVRVVHSHNTRIKKIRNHGENVNHGIRTDGQKIRQLRHELGVTQEEAAQNAEVSKRTIEKAEQGSFVRRGTAKLIATSLGVSVEDIVVSVDVSEVAPFVRQTAIAATEAWLTNVLAINVRLEAVSQEMVGCSAVDCSYFARRLRDLLRQLSSYYPASWHKNVEGVKEWHDISIELKATIAVVDGMASELDGVETQGSFQARSEALVECARQLWAVTEKLINSAESELNYRFDKAHGLRGPHFVMPHSSPKDSQAG